MQRTLLEKLSAKIHKLSIAITAVLLFSFQGYSQELGFVVTVNSDKVRSTDRSVFDDMETSFTQFLNQRIWTNDIYKPHERIKCNLNIIIDCHANVLIKTDININVNIHIHHNLKIHAINDIDNNTHNDMNI